MDRLETVLSVYRAHMSMSSSSNHADWGNSNLESLRVVLQVRELRMKKDEPE